MPDSTRRQFIAQAAAIGAAAVLVPAAATAAQVTFPQQEAKMPTIVQMGFKLNVPASEYRAIADSVAPAFASVPGLLWKIWFLNEAAGVAGGVYLFEDEAARDAFLASDLATQVKNATFHAGLEVKLFDVMGNVTAVTRGPVQAAVAQAATG